MQTEPSIPPGGSLPLPLPLPLGLVRLRLGRVCASVRAQQASAAARFERSRARAPGAALVRAWWCAPRRSALTNKSGCHRLKKIVRRDFGPRSEVYWLIEERQHI